KAIAKSKIFQAIAKSKVGRAILRAGQSIKALYGKGKKAVQDAKAKLKAKWEKWKQEREKRRKERRAQAREKPIERIKSMLSKGTPHTWLKAQLLILKLRYGWKSLTAHINRSDGTLTIDGSMSPGETLATGSAVLEEISTGVEVKINPNAEALLSEKYEAEAGKQYVEPILAPELFGKGRFEVTRTFGPLAKKRGYKSTLDMVRFEQ